MIKIFNQVNSKLTDDETVLEVRQILGSHYAGLYNYFCENFFKFEHNTYTVLITRRCSVIALWYLDLLLSRLKDKINKKYDVIDEGGLICVYNREIKCKNYIVTDKYIKSLSKLDSNYIYNIVDDICIHGRNINKLKEEILRCLGDPKGQVFTSVYMTSMDSVIEETDVSIVRNYGNEWVELSIALADCINYLNLPYVSYLNNFMLFEVAKEIFEQFIKLLKENNSLEIREFASDRQKSFGRSSYMLLEKTSEALECEIFKGCRIYYNEKTQTMGIIPYVLLKSMTIEQMKMHIKHYWIGNSSILEGTVLTAYTIFSCIASNYFGFYLFSKYINSALSKVNLDLGKIVQDYYLILKTIFAEKINKEIHLKSNYRMKNDSISIDSDETSQYISKRDSRFKGISVDAVIRNQWYAGEINACLLLDKVEGIPVEDSLVDLRGQISEQEVISLIRSCDTGLAYIAVDAKGGRGYSYFNAGELGFRLVTHNGSLKEKEMITALKKASEYYRKLLG